MKESEEYDLTSLISMGSSWNLQINPNIDRKCVDGRWGMFATGKINSSEVLISSNLPSTLIYGSIDEMIGKYAVEYEKGVDSTLTPWFNTIQPDIDGLKCNATYHSSPAELETLFTLSPLVHSNVIDYIKSTTVVRDRIVSEYNCSKDTVEMMILMKESRAWEFGFMPGFDLFNHNARNGNPMYIANEGEYPSYKFLSAREYNIGDEIYVSYNVKDSMKYCINYNFFDSSDIHTVNILQRIYLNIGNIDMQSKLKSLFDVQEYTVNNQTVFQIQSNAPIIAGNLSTALFDIVSQLSKDKNDRINDVIFTGTLMSWLQSASHIISTDTLIEEKLTPRISRFNQCLKADNKAIRQCMDWLILNNTTYQNTFLREYTKN